MEIKNKARAAKNAAHQMAVATTQQKNEALQAFIENVKKNQSAIFDANRQDRIAAQEKGLTPALLERLSLENRLDSILQDIQHVISLDDPISESFECKTLANGLKVEKRRTPLGVLGVIYESRPNVTFEIAALTIKSGNCALLRGGSETLFTNQMIFALIQESLAQVNLPKDAIQFVESSDRQRIWEMLQEYESIDLIIPRGGAALQKFCRENSKIPVITGGIGICHLFVDASADLKKSIEVIVNAKTQRHTVCNALGTLLVHEAIAPHFIPTLISALSTVECRLCPEAQKWVHGTPAESSDWDTEWLSLVLGIKVVRDLEEAIAHIRTHGTHHSDGILTENPEQAKAFVAAIDSAAVYVNASLRFTDGAQFGLGGEVAVSTQKLHARGPMGLKELTSYKWVIQGDYQIRF